jgi:hypothetical protein
LITETHKFKLSDDFFESYWLKRPTVIKNPGFSIANKNSCTASISSLLKIGRSADPIHTPRLTINHNRKEFYDLNFDQMKGSDFSLIINNVQSLDHDIFSKSCFFLNDLYKKTGFPKSGALLDLFWSNSKKSSLDLHKDEQEVFTFVIEGKKKFYTWPFEYFQNILNLPGYLKYKTHPLDGFDFESHLDHAIALEAEEGDMIYWPSNYWHIGVSDSDFPALTLGLGLFQRETQPFYFHSLASDYLYSLGIDEELSFESDDLLKNPFFKERLEIEKYKWKSSFGFKSVPKPIQNDLPRDFTEAKLVKSSTIPVEIIESEDNFHLFYLGQHFKVAISQFSKLVLEKIKNSENIVLSEVFKNTDSFRDINSNEIEPKSDPPSRSTRASNEIIKFVLSLYACGIFKISETNLNYSRPNSDLFS